MGLDLLHERDGNVGQVYHLSCYRSEKQALNAAETTRPHDDLPCVLLARDLGDGLGDLSHSNQGLEGYVGTFAFAEGVA